MGVLSPHYSLSLAGTGSIFHLPSDFGFLHYRNIVFAVRLPGDAQEAPKLFWR